MAIIQFFPFVLFINRPLHEKLIFLLLFKRKKAKLVSLNYVTHFNKQIILTIQAIL